jgi:hypothetical protein
MPITAPKKRTKNKPKPTASGVNHDMTIEDLAVARAMCLLVIVVIIALALAYA